MTPEQCKALRDVLRVQGVKQFRRILSETQDEKIELLLEVFLNLSSLAETRKEKSFVKKYKSVLKKAEKIVSLKSAKKFLAEHFPLLKKAIATVVLGSICSEIASSILEHGG